MTKERRLAIEMWEQIVEALEHDSRNVYEEVNQIKARFCCEHTLNWKCECWFCQYVRQDWRAMPSREAISKRVNGCQKCPLYKEHEDSLDYDECGCTNDKQTLWTRVSDYEDVEAARRILELLRGNK